MKFNFKLKSILTLREYQMDCARTEYGLAVSKTAAANLAVETCEQKKKALEDYLGALLSQNAPIAEIMAIRQSLPFLEGELRAAQALAEQALLNQNQKRIIFLKAKQTADLIDKLKEHQLNQCKLEEVRQEQLLLDDLFVSRYTKASP